MKPTIFLSASVPFREPYASDVPPDATFEIGEAVTALATAVFASGGRIVFGGHPSITPLIAQTAFDFYGFDEAISDEDDESGEANSIKVVAPSLPEEPPVVVYQSGWFEPEFIPELYQLVDARKGEQAMADFRHIQKGASQDASLKDMREEMIQNHSYDAMFAIGGMEGVVDEANLFAPSGEPIYAMIGTGGAARQLAREREKRPTLVAVDNDFLAGLVRSLETAQAPAGGLPKLELADVSARVDEPGADPLPMTPYAPIMRRLVRRVIAGVDRRPT